MTVPTDDQIYLPQTPAGGTGGTSYDTTWRTLDSTMTDFSLVQSITFKVVSPNDKPKSLLGFFVTYTNGRDSATVGSTKSAESLTLTVGADKVITQLVAYWTGSADTARIAGLYFEFSDKTTQTVGSTTDSGQKFIVGDGLLAGLVGTSDGNGVIGISPRFLRKVGSVAITNVQLNSNYLVPKPKTAEMVPPNKFQLSAIAQTLVLNHTSDAISWEFSGSVTRTTEIGWEQSSTTQFKDTVTVEANFFDIVKVSNAFEWSKSQTNTTSGSVSNSVEIGWSASGSLPRAANAIIPGLVGNAFIRSGVLDVPYTCTVTVLLLPELTGGTGGQYGLPITLSYTEHGTLKGAQYSSATMVVGRADATGKIQVIHSSEPTVAVGDEMLA